jgi:hypothetical protein
VRDGGRGHPNRAVKALFQSDIFVSDEEFTTKNDVDEVEQRLVGRNRRNFANSSKADGVKLHKIRCLIILIFIGDSEYAYAELASTSILMINLPFFLLTCSSTSLLILFP